MNSKQIGNIGEAKVLSKFIELGFPVYIPFGDNEKADLVVEFNGKLNKVQVKTSIDAKNGNVIFDLTSSTAHRKNGMRHKYTIDEVDYFALYNLCRDKIYLLKFLKRRLPQFDLDMNILKMDRLVAFILKMIT